MITESSSSWFLCRVLTEAWRLSTESTTFSLFLAEFLLGLLAFLAGRGCFDYVGPLATALIASSSVFKYVATLSISGSGDRRCTWRFACFVADAFGGRALSCGFWVSMADLPRLGVFSCF